MTSANETRILKAPSLAARYTLVTMPRTAWYWLDDLVRRKYPTGGYHAMIEAFRKRNAQNPPPKEPALKACSRHLSAMAENHNAARMATLYHLSNDNVTDTPRWHNRHGQARSAPTIHLAPAHGFPPFPLHAPCHISDHGVRVISSSLAMP